MKIAKPTKKTKASKKTPKPRTKTKGMAKNPSAKAASKAKPSALQEKLGKPLRGYPLQLMLSQEQALFLGRLQLDMLEKTGANISRTDIVRALLGALQRSGLANELSYKTTAAQIEDRLLTRLKVSGLEKPKRVKKKKSKAKTQVAKSE